MRRGLPTSSSDSRSSAALVKKGNRERSEESQRLEALFQESDEIATAIALSYVDALIDSANRYADVIEYGARLVSRHSTASSSWAEQRDAMDGD